MYRIKKTGLSWLYSRMEKLTVFRSMEDLLKSWDSEEEDVEPYDPKLHQPHIAIWQKDEVIVNAH